MCVGSAGGLKVVDVGRTETMEGVRRRHRGVLGIRIFKAPGRTAGWGRRKSCVELVL